MNLDWVTSGVLQTWNSKGFPKMCGTINHDSSAPPPPLLISLETICLFFVFATIQSIDTERRNALAFVIAAKSIPMFGVSFTSIFRFQWIELFMQFIYFFFFRSECNERTGRWVQVHISVCVCVGRGTSGCICAIATINDKITVNFILCYYFQTKYLQIGVNQIKTTHLKYKSVTIMWNNILTKWYPYGSSPCNK